LYQILEPSDKESDLMDSIPSQLLLQMILILLNAFFAATEIAVLSLNSNQLEKKAEQGDKTSQRLLSLTKEPASFLSTIQIGITLAGFLGSAFAADNFSEYLVDWIYNGLQFHTIPIATLDTLSVIVITFILSYFTLVFGELVPKRIAMQKPYEVSRFSCGIVFIVSKIMKPFVSFLSISTNVILKLLHMNTEAQEESVSEEDILMMVELGEKRGVLNEDESEWIQNVIDFDDTHVKEIMTRSIDIIAIDYNASQEEILNIIQQTGISRYPIYKDDDQHIIGILHAKDYLLNLQTHTKTLDDLLSEPYFIPETMKADDLFDDMQQKKKHIALAVDEFGEMSGLITLEDLMEEIFGNIYDEHDPYEKPAIQKLQDNKWLVHGDMNIDELSEILQITIPSHEGYDTIGGYVLGHLRSIPQDGTTKTITINQFSFTITKIQQRRIKELIITLL